MTGPKPLTGLLRNLVRAPILLYRLGLGWVLGKRFLLLIHTGRVSGARRRTVLEVVRYDPDTQTAYVVSAWGERSDWYRNLMATPEAVVHHGRQVRRVVACRLSIPEAEQVMLDYGTRHPTALRSLARALGYALDPSPEGYREVGRRVPVLALEPVTTGPPEPGR